MAWIQATRAVARHSRRLGSIIGNLARARNAGKATSGRQLRWRAYGAFVASGIAGVIANTATLVIASNWLSVPAAKILAIAASFVVNFSLSHFVVFRTRHRPAGTSAE